VGGNIRIDLKEIGWEGMECTYLAQNRDKEQAVVNMVMKLWVPQNARNFVTS
jgi:hypothetical protein